MDLPAPDRWSIRALAVAILVVLAVAGGALAADMAPAAEAADVVVAPVVLPPEAPSHEPIAAVGVALIDGLRVDLPVPEPASANPREPTPEIRHGQLEIPSIGLSQPFFEGVTLTAIDRGPSHWPGTAMPGALGNVVIAGHRTTRTRPFWDLALVQPGDELIFTMTSGERHVYSFDRIEIVDEDALRIVDQEYGYTATVFGCHPKGSARQRIVGHFTLKSSLPRVGSTA